jgi:hypothetical protein
MVIILIKFVKFNLNLNLNFRGCKDGLVNEVDGFCKKIKKKIFEILKKKVLNMNELII